MWVIGSVCDSLYERFSYKSCEEGSNERTRSCERKCHQFTECPLWGVEDGRLYVRDEGKPACLLLSGPTASALIYAIRKDHGFSQSGPRLLLPFHNHREQQLIPA